IGFDTLSNDLLDIGNTATLDGNVTFAMLEGGVADGTSFTFLQAGGGIAGIFPDIDGPLFFNPVVTINANDAEVTLNRLSYTTAARTLSERAVATALDDAFAADPAGMAATDLILNNLATAA